MNEVRVILNCGVLFCLLLSHVISEFVFQSTSIVRLKYSENAKNRLLGNFNHSCIYFFVALIMMLYYWSPIFFWLVPIVALFHGVLGLAKSWIVFIRPFLKHSIFIFLTDQLFHIISICFISYFISINLPREPYLLPLIKWSSSFINLCVKDVTYNQKILLSIVLLVIGLWGVSVFIPVFLDRIKLPFKKVQNTIIEIIQDSKKGGAPNGGLIIGLLERLFIICSIVLGIAQNAQMIQIVGFVLAAKSVARFKEFDDRDFVEYFIIGSFISFTSAIIVGVAIRALLDKN